MSKNCTTEILFFRVIDSHWKCINPQAFSGTLADFLALLGIDSLPDSLEFGCLHIQDNFYILIYQGAMCVKFKLINKPSNFLQMNKIPKIEINSIPSQLNTENPSGVASQLANVAADPLHFDGVSIEMMRNNPLYDRIDDIDKRGRAIEALEKTAKTVHSNRAKIRKFNEIGQQMLKPGR